MQHASLNVILSLLLLTPAVLSEIDVKLNHDEDLKDHKRFDLKATTTLKCTVTGNDGVDVEWRKEGKKVEKNDRISVSEDKNVFSLTIKPSRQDDAGQYQCVVSKEGEELKTANVTLITRVYVKTPANLNFVEGEQIKIICQVSGQPASISWSVGNETYEESNDRVQLETDPESNIANTVFIIKEAKMTDRTEYVCMATPQVGTDSVTAKTMVRIKDKYAALWPFLGICAEVFVLCAIILIYEKKRNKTELEESDTDQSPDQKNTPDHGKDSNLRHRQ